MRLQQAQLGDYNKGYPNNQRGVLGHSMPVTSVKYRVMLHESTCIGERTKLHELVFEGQGKTREMQIRDVAKQVRKYINALQYKIEVM